MTVVLEEKVPMIHDYLVEQYGRFSQSAVDSVSQGLKKAISLGIASNKEKSVFESKTLGGPDTTQATLGPLIGTKISEAASVPSPEQLFQPEFKGMEKAQNAELTAFSKNVFGQTGSLKSLEERGIIIICRPEESSAAAKGMIINGRIQSERGAVAPEYFPTETVRNTGIFALNAMEETLKKTLALQKEIQQFNLPVKS